MKKIATIVFASILAIAMAGCSKDKETPDNPDNKETTLQNVTLKGRVSDKSGNPLSGVRVTTGTLSTTTDNNGGFSFSQAKVVNSRTVIQFEKSGYFTLTRSGVKTDEMFIEAVMYQKGNSDISLKTSFDASSAKELEIGGMKVALSASSVVRADGSAYTGNVNADMLYLDPNNENFAGLMPGGDLAAIRSDNSDVMLISWGMVNVNLTDDAGKSLQLKDGSPAALTFPIPEGMKKSPPPTIPLWHFDENKGIWIESGVATLQGDVYVGTAAHFSWVNLDEPAKRVTIKGKVVDCKNNPVPYVQVKADQTSGITNSKGEYSVIVPENTPVTLSVTANGGSDSQNVPGQPGGTTHTASNLKVPCGGGDDNPGELGTYSKTEKGSVKYLVDGEAYYIITFDNNGKRYRCDVINPDDPDDHVVYIINHFTKTNWIGYAYDGENHWQDESYDYTENPGAAIYSYDEMGLTSQSTVTIAGKSCKVYVQKSGGYEMKWALWNGLMMLFEMDGEVLFIATAATLEVPEIAFTKTMNISWLP